MKVIADKYRVLRELGRGSYGTVYLVEHVYLGIRYALKLLSRSFSDNQDFLERFKREAEILVRFSHPGTVQLRDFGKDSAGMYYMATDFCPGHVLEEILAKERWFPVLKAFDIMIQVLDVLEAAHALEIVHRDIKPSNIMLDRDAEGREIVKVLDFGIATITQDVWENSRVTGEGYSIGTPEYMSPEQASGEGHIDFHTDIYSCGVLFYELITGDVPFRGNSVVKTLLKHMTQPVPPFSERLGVPVYVEELVCKALAKEPFDRYGSVREFKEACLDALARIRREGAMERSVEINLDDLGASGAFEAPPTEKRPRTKILCLDDTEMILHITRHIFEQEGFEVFTASSFTSIYDYIFKYGATLLLCDVNMPGTSGNKICQMLKESVPELKIILFSNIPERELEKLSTESHADAWISKNAKPAEWIAAVRRVLGE